MLLHYKITIEDVGYALQKAKNKKDSKFHCAKRGVDRTRTHIEIYRMFNLNTVSKIEKKFKEYGIVKDLPRTLRTKVVNDENSLKVLLSIHRNRQSTTQTCT
ncbi:hypothetical protein ILUMI_25023 [Ignelater luminosus]|uniref:Uncharacterized protein n=1 Tax=Ignelater luminosus TaxID=2038154 RepID=A0A8K0C827_IGNLU|nr:hypothetical protein ILUMI_25023 [Ignelater luminosus]